MCASVGASVDGRAHQRNCLVRAATAAARLVHRGGGGRPQLAAVVAFAYRLEHAVRLSVGVGKHRAVLFDVEGRAAPLLALAVHRFQIDVAAARFDGGLFHHTVHVHHAVA